MKTLLAFAVFSIGLTGVASAVPIVYLGNLEPGIPVAGVNTQGPSNEDNPIGANYYTFISDGVSPITIFGDRQAGHFDMSFWIFAGTFADTSAFGASFDAGDPGFIDFGDDDDPPNIAGPFGDPRSVFGSLPAGVYTVAVTNFLSGAGGPPNPFTLQANGVVPSPEPATMLAWSLIAGVGAMGYRLRKRTAAVVA